jgi:hypothetical protein
MPDGPGEQWSLPAYTAFVTPAGGWPRRWDLHVSGMGVTRVRGWTLAARARNAWRMAVDYIVVANQWSPGQFSLDIAARDGDWPAGQAVAVRKALAATPPPPRHRPRREDVVKNRRLP